VSSKEPVNILLVDDQPAKLLSYEVILGELGETLIKAGSAREALAQLLRNDVAVVLIDVQMPELDGFDVITEVGTDKMPPVIFVTAFDDYAVSAFEFGAFDYLLKPVDHVRFHQTLDRAKKRLKESPPGPTVSNQLSALLKYVGQLDAPKNRIGVKVNGKILFLDPDEIFWIQARDDLARIHLAEVAYDVREPLSRLEARLPHNRFLRVHRSTIVNTAQVREAQPFDQGDQLLILRNGKRITTGRSYRKAVQEFLKRAT